ncbi:MAG: hypothetical protein LBK06_04355 [Planctomycetaceae bacterium]|jgi:hypothetical protein|nr:hypothetical protein [Planctomycetaceae bacterium]
MRKEIVFLVLLICCLFICPLFGQNIQRDNSNELNEKEFIEKYAKWLPERIVSYGQLKGGARPDPNRDNLIWLKCDASKYESQWFFRIYFTAHDDAHIEAPYSDFFAKLKSSDYQIQVNYIPRYSIFPIFGRFYYVDFLEKFDESASEDIKYCLGVAHRLRSEEYPPEISLSHKSIVFLCMSPKQKEELRDREHTYNNKLHDYDVYVTDIQPPQNSQTKCRARIVLDSPGYRNIMREDWYEVGDILEFAQVKYRIINIVAPRELEIRGHKCHLIGYVELDPQAIPLEKLRMEETEEYPSQRPIPKPALTEEEKLEMRTWTITKADANNKNVSQKVIAAFLRINEQIVHLRYQDMRYDAIQLNRFSQSDQKLIHEIVSQRNQFSAVDGIDFSFLPQDKNSEYADEKREVLKHVIGEEIRLILKVKNVSSSSISIYKKQLSDNDCYDVYLYTGDWESMKSKFVKYKPISIEPKDWITLEPNEEYLHLFQQDKFAGWQLPRKGFTSNFSMLGTNRFVYQHEKLDMPLELRKKLVANGIPAKIFVGREYGMSGVISIQVIPPPIETKELLLQKVVKYIERTFTKAEVEEILKFNGGGDIYSDNAKDMIKTFLQTYTLAANELEALLIANVMIDGFERQEFVYRRLGMFGTDTAKQARDKMQVAAREKYKKELTDAVVENEMTNDDKEDLPDTTTPSEPSPQLSSPQPTTKSITQSTAIYFVLLFVLLFLVIIVALIYRRKR